jgi:hypothetical protein
VPRPADAGWQRSPEVGDVEDDASAGAGVRGKAVDEDVTVATDKRLPVWVLRREAMPAIS